MSDVVCGLQKLPEFKLVSGVGDYRKCEVCLMSVAVACYRLSKGESMADVTDEMECCCPLIRKFLITLNDSSIWRDDAHRTAVLMPFVPRLAGTKNDVLLPKRAFMLADWSIHVITVRALVAANLQDAANKLLALPKIVDEKTAADAARVAADAADAADAAAYAAYAAYAADAADAAYAADAAAYAAYAAVYAAAHAADAAVYAAAHAADAAVYAAADAAAHAAAHDEIRADCVTIIDRLLTLSE